ncbi:MAG: OmpA family protein [Pseudomonadota bacterium]
MHMKRIGLPLVILLLPAVAGADPQFTADDIVAHFAKQTQRSAPAPSSGVVIKGETSTVDKPQFGSVVNPGGTKVLSDGLVIPLTGANRSAGQKTSVAVASTEAPAQQPAGDAGYDLLVTFELASDTLTDQAQRNLREFAIALQTPALAGFKFAVEGHTDASGSAEKNLKLSERRAASVVTFLTSLGVQEKRLSAKGYGETRPLLSDPEDPGNRRVETRRVE